MFASIATDMNTQSTQLSRALGDGSALMSNSPNVGMRAWHPPYLLPKISTVSLVLVAAVSTGAGLLIRDALGDQTWLHAIQDTFVQLGQDIQVGFNSAPALSSTAAVASYFGAGAFLACLYNLSVFSTGLKGSNQPLSAQSTRGVKTTVSAAAAGTAIGGMVGTLSAGIGLVPGVLGGLSIGAGVGLVQAILLVAKR